MSEAWARRLYRAMLVALTPLLLIHLVYRGRRQPAYLKHIGERFGYYKATADVGRVWVHAVSVGETKACEPLLKALIDRYPQTRFVLTHTTPTGRQTEIDARIDALRVYLPYDYPGAVRRFYQAFKPQMGLLMETEVWPQLVLQGHLSGVPLALLNARLSQRSVKKGRRYRALLAPTLARLQLILAQTEGDADRLRQLGAPSPQVVGNIKFDQTIPEKQSLLAGAFRDCASGRAIFLMASTREGEERLLLDAWIGSAVEPKPLLVIVPRHPQRFDSIAAMIAATGAVWQRRSESKPLSADCQIVLGDSMGEMLAYYGSADVSYIGGGLLPFGTHNLIESCAMGCPVLLGPHVFNFAQAANDAIAAGAAVSCADASNVVASGLSILADDVLRQRMADAARGFAAAHQGATRRSVDALAQILDSVLQQHVDGH